MLKSITRFMSLILSCVAVFMLYVTPVFASEVQVVEIIPSDFDAPYYAERYPDVKTALGTDPVVLYDHYKTFGANEGRFKNALEEQNAVTRPTCPSTYVDVDLDKQIVTLFEDGIAKMSSPCVTGNVSTNHSTPAGTYQILVMTPGKYLDGPTWHRWVDSWMKFTPDAIGLHDAVWRDAFGGDIYKTDGSHGCVNLPHEFAIALYNNVSVGTTVVVH